MRFMNSTNSQWILIQYHVPRFDGCFFPGHTRTHGILLSVLDIAYYIHSKWPCEMLILVCIHFIWSKWQSIGTMDVRYTSNSIRRRMKSCILFKRRSSRKKWSPVRRHRMQQQILSTCAAFSCCDSLLFLLPLSFFSSKFASREKIKFCETLMVYSTQQSVDFNIFSHKIEQFQATILRHLLEIVCLLSISLTLCWASCYSKACIYLLCQSIIMPIFYS